MDEYQSRRLDLLMGQQTIGREETGERLEVLKQSAPKEPNANSPRDVFGTRSAFLKVIGTAP